MFKKSALVFTLCAFAMTPLSGAYAAKKLTEDMIKKHYAESAAMQTKTAKEIIPRLEKHVHEDIVLTMKTAIKIEGAPTQNDETTMGKEEILKHTMDGLDAGEIHKVEEKVMAVDIADDGRSAKAKDSVYSIMSITVPTPQGEMIFDSEAMMFCSDHIVLNDDDVIQLLKSDCSNEVTMKPRK